MTKSELFKLLDKLEREKGLQYEVGENFEGVQYIRFEVDDDDATNYLVRRLTKKSLRLQMTRATR
jgi:hypothetical protein